VLGTLLVSTFPVWLTVAQVLWVRFCTPPFTMTMVQRSFEHASAGEGLAWPDRKVVRLSEMGGSVPRAVVAAEDAAFYLHDGFDWKSVCDAVDAAGSGRRLRGASTITQQTAKNVFLWQGRSWIRKGLEVWYTMLLELLVPKNRILELYLNVAETGPMVFGVEAGARHHFGRPAGDLTLDQAGRLAGIFPDPRRRSVKGSSAGERASFVRSHPASFPGDPGFALVRDAFLKAAPRHPWQCLL
jgi:monofunctional biosynthetic peptidoglycan transglycosylase